MNCRAKVISNASSTYSSGTYKDEGYDIAKELGSKFYELFLILLITYAVKKLCFIDG